MAEPLVRLAAHPTIDGVELAPLAKGQLLPPRAFTSPHIYHHEQEAIFARSWIHVADVIDLPEPGSYVAAMIGRTPVVIVRDHDSGALRGFLNACRHRGTLLVEGRGCGRQLQCPYHGWSYRTDGQLVGIPF